MYETIRALLGKLAEIPTPFSSDWVAIEDASRPITLCCDACSDGIRHAVTEIVSMRSVVFISRATLDTDRNRMSFDTQAGAIIWVKKTSPWLPAMDHLSHFSDNQALGDHAKISDHSPLFGDGLNL